MLHTHLDVVRVGGETLLETLYSTPIFAELLQATTHTTEAEYMVLAIKDHSAACERRSPFRRQVDTATAVPGFPREGATKKQRNNVNHGRPGLSTLGRSYERMKELWSLHYTVPSDRHSFHKTLVKLYDQE